MKIARYQLGHSVRIGRLEGDGVRDMGTDLFAHLQVFGQTHTLDQVKLLAPLVPRKIVGIGNNYFEHAREMGHEPPAQPDIFLKPGTAVIGPDDAIEIPAVSQQVELEAELAVIVGRTLRDATVEEAAIAVLGYTCINDVTARDLQRSDRTWARGKGHDTFAPLGPFIATNLDPGNLLIESYVNGVRKQYARTRQMLQNVPQLLSYISSIMTLEPGDVVATGTPAGVARIQPGDVVEVVIEGIGSLRNPVVARGASPDIA